MLISKTIKRQNSSGQWIVNDSELIQPFIGCSRFFASSWHWNANENETDGALTSPPAHSRLTDSSLTHMLWRHGLKSRWRSARQTFIILSDLQSWNLRARQTTIKLKIYQITGLRKPLINIIDKDWTKSFPLNPRCAGNLGLESIFPSVIT